MLHLWKGFHMRSTIFALLAGVSAAALTGTGALADNIPLGLTGSDYQGAWILKDASGQGVQVSGNVDRGTVTATYAAESSYAGYTGGLDANGNVQFDNTTHAFLPTSAACPASDACVTVNPSTTLDSNIRFVQATYADAGNYGTRYVDPAHSGQVLLDPNGNIVQNSATPGEIAAGHWEQASATDSQATKTSLSVPSQDVVVDHVKSRSAVTATGANHTDSAAGGVVYSTTDKTGVAQAWTSAGPGGVIVANKTGSSSTMTAGQIALTGATAGYGITLDANADPIITVTNGTAAGTTTIHNGDVSAGSSMTVGTGSNKTTISGGNIATSGTVSASSVVATTGSFDTLSTTGYADVGVTLTSYGSQLAADGTAIKMLNGQVVNAQNTANKALAAAAIGAALPTLHWAPGDWLAVAAGGADAGGQGAWGLSAGALVTPRLAVSIKGGQSGNTGVVAGQVSYSFGGGNYPLK